MKLIKVCLIKIQFNQNKLRKDYSNNNKINLKTKIMLIPISMMRMKIKMISKINLQHQKQDKLKHLFGNISIEKYWILVMLIAILKMVFNMIVFLSFFIFYFFKIKES